ncbi:hypothetical protein F4825DRAFT_8186 [Nemania diffusa]|nr:hypothetical protein F4825DRAFT_8186 [Nemania diffusa]
MYIEIMGVIEINVPTCLFLFLLMYNNKCTWPHNYTLVMVFVWPVCLLIGYLFVLE